MYEDVIRSLRCPECGDISLALSGGIARDILGCSSCGWWIFFSQKVLNEIIADQEDLK